MTTKEKAIQVEAEQMHNGVGPGSEVRASWLLTINTLMEDIKYINFSDLPSLTF